MLKAFHYTIDATAAAIDVNDTMKTTSLLRELDEMMKKEEAAAYSNFVISDEEKARIECLKGQVNLSLSYFDKKGVVDDGIQIYQDTRRSVEKQYKMI